MPSAPNWSERPERGRAKVTAGTDLPSRLGLDADAPADVVARALNDAVARWQRRAESPVSPQAAVEAAEVVVRTCEGLAAALAAETTPR